MAGIVYILTNRAMPGYVKIGRTGEKPENLEERIRSLDGTNLPLPFECFYAARVEDANKVERLLHSAFGTMRVRMNREFFEMDPSHARSALQISGGEEMTPRELIAEDDATKKAIVNTRRPPTTFKMLDIEPGTELYFWKDETITCQTVNRKHRILFEGQETTISPAARTIRDRQGFSTDVAGTDYWMFEGETLSARRRRLEEGREQEEDDE